MNPNVWSVKGRGSAEVYRDGNLRAVARDNNMILDNFWNWVSSNIPLVSLSVAGKVGTGSSPSVATMSALEAPVTLETGLWPSQTNVSGNVATVVEGGTKLRATIDFELSFAVGQINANISEYGIDLTVDNQPNSAVVHTRVQTKDENGQPTTLPVTLQDQLVLRYQLEMTADLDQPAYTLGVDKDGTVTQHQVKMYWGPATNFITYLNHGGAGGGGTILRLGYASALSGNLTQQTLDESAQAGALNWVYDTDKVTANVTVASDQANLTNGINIIRSERTDCWWRFHIDPPLPKADGQRLDLVIERPNRGVPAGGGEPPATGSPIVAFTSGTWKWPAQDDAKYFHNDETALLSLAETYDDGVRQAAFLAGVGNDSWTEVPQSGSVNGVWNVEVPNGDNAYAYVSFGIGQYANRAQEVSLETISESYVTFEVDGASVKYKLGRHPTQANVAWFKETAPGSGTYETTATYLDGLNQSYGDPMYFGSVEAAKFNMYVQSIADLFPGKFAAYNGWDQVGSFLVHLTFGTGDPADDYFDVSYTVNVTGALVAGAWVQDAWVWKDHGKTEFPDNEMTASTEVAVWDNGELQIGMLLSANVFDNAAYTTTPVGNVWELDIPDDADYGPYAFMAFGVGMYQGRDGTKPLGDYYDVTVRIWNGNADHTYDMTWVDSMGGYYDLVPRDGAPALAEDNLQNSYGTIEPYYSGAVEWQTWEYYPQNALNTVFGPFSDLNGVAQLGEWNVRITATPKLGGTPIMGEMLFRTVAGGPRGGDTPPPEMPADSPYTLSGFNWTDPADTNMMNADVGAPVADTAVFDNGEFQMSMIAGATTEAGVYQKATLTDGTWDVAIPEQSGTEVHKGWVVVGFGQYANITNTENFIDDYDVYLAIGTQSSGANFRLAMDTGTSTIKGFAETAPGVWSTTPEDFNGGMTPVFHPVMAGTYWTAMRIYLDIDYLAKKYMAGQLATLNGLEQLGNIAVTLQCVPKDPANTHGTLYRFMPVNLTKGALMP